MWSYQKTQLEKFDGERIFIESRTILSYQQVVDLWIESEKFRSFFLSILDELPYSSFRWETPPVTNLTRHQPFEFVALNAPELDREADQTTFSSLFDKIEPGSVGRIHNLGGDAIMIIPSPVDDGSSYGHLGSFLRTGSQSQRHELLTLVAKTVKERIGEKPMWLNTAGTGVSWLHIRLDDRPKYYLYGPYRTSCVR